MNEQYFNKEQIENNELTEFINLLVKQSYGKSECLNDIRIIPFDLGAVNVEWGVRDWKNRYGGHFEWIDDDMEEVVAKYYTFPDGHCELLERDDKEFEEILHDWLEEHKEEGWYKNEWGQWRSKKSEEELKRSLEEDNNEQLDNNED